MRALVTTVIFGLVVGGSLPSPALADDHPPAWAYPMNPPGFKSPPDDGTLRHVPDSTAAFTLTQARDLFLALDWHPADHPPLPDVVAHGRKPDVMACGVCHRAEGTGGPENAAIAGLPAQYITQQINDFKSGARRTSVPQRVPPKLMVRLSKALTPSEIEAAAGYFAALKPRATITVVETDTVPRTRVAGGFMVASTTGATEPIAGRIIEVPEDPERFDMRDTRARFIAYAPPGSIATGRALVATGGAGKTVACAICHGSRPEGAGADPRHCRPLAELPRAPVVRFSARGTGRARQRLDEACRRPADDRRHGGARRLCGVIAPLSALHAPLGRCRPRLS